MATGSFLIELYDIQKLDDRFPLLALRQILFAVFKWSAFLASVEQAELEIKMTRETTSPRIEMKVVSTRPDRCKRLRKKG